MRYPAATIIITLGAALAGVAVAAAPDGGWRWPVATRPAISSNFCEYRDGRFHAGIDARTFGREGIPCLAVADGWISRVRASSRGYGKALHLTLETGEQVVYAHLAEFAPHLEDTLWAAQSRDTAYAVDLRMPPGRFRVQAGDTIGFSGMTGAVAPHLHLEVRDASDRPVNPSREALPLPDALHPVVARVVFVPLAPGATVNGRPLPLGLAPVHAGPGRFQVTDTLRIRGPVGVAVAVNDRVNAESGVLAPRAIELVVADSLVARLAFDRFRFEESADVDLVLHAGALRARGSSIYQLYDRGATVARQFLAGNGTLPAGTGAVRAGVVRAEDAAGNTGELRFHYRDDDGRTGPAPEKKWARRDFAVDAGDAFFHDGFAVLPGRDGPGDETTLEARVLGSTVRGVVAPADSDTAVVWVAGVDAGAARRVAFPALGAELDIPAGATRVATLFYARGAYGVVGVGGTGDGPDGRAPRTRPVRIGPVGWVLDTDVTVALRADSLGPRDAIFRRDDYRRSWSWLASEADSAGTIRAATRRPGIFAVFRDDVPPVVGAPVAGFSHSYATADTTVEIHIPVDDTGSGFDEARTVIRVGDVRRVFRWDFVGKKIIVPLRGEPIIGPLSVRAVVFDRIGNRTAVEAPVDPRAR
jgi:hypothetical protein